MTVLPNSAPDSLTPKYLNLVKAPEQVVPEGFDADVVVVAVVVIVVELDAVVPVLDPGRHW